MVYKKKVTESKTLCTHIDLKSEFTYIEKYGYRVASILTKLSKFLILTK